MTLRLHLVEKFVDWGTLCPLNGVGDLLHRLILYLQFWTFPYSFRVGARKGNLHGSTFFILTRDLSSHTSVVLNHNKCFTYLVFFYFIHRPNNISRFPFFFSTKEKSLSKIALLNCCAFFFMATSVVSLAACFVTSRTPFPITPIHLSRMFIIFYWAPTWPMGRARNETRRYHAGYPPLPHSHFPWTDHQRLWPGLRLWGLVWLLP